MKTLYFLFIFYLLVGCENNFYRMPTPSMEPSINQGSILTVDHRAFESIPPERFDILVFRVTYPQISKTSDETGPRLQCKRVIALPGESIKITDDEVIINNNTLKTPNNIIYLEQGPYSNYTLGTDEYFLLGDNSKYALDSRYYGSVSRSDIIGKVIHIDN